jgi:hypothetical protein
MKPVITLTTLLLIIDPCASIARPNQMQGQDWGTKGYKRANMEKRGVWTCSGYVGICTRRGNKASVCQAAGVQCMQTGVFVGPQGAQFGGLRMKYAEPRPYAEPEKAARRAAFLFKPQIGKLSDETSETGGKWLK